VPGLPPVAAKLTPPVRGMNAPSPAMYSIGTRRTQPSTNCQTGAGVEGASVVRSPRATISRSSRLNVFTFLT
jgi:hypothetical protein